MRRWRRHPGVRGVVVLHHRIGCYRVCRLEAIPNVASVGTDLPEFSEVAQRNVCRVPTARNPHFTIFQQPERCAHQVGAGELHAGPLLASKLSLAGKEESSRKEDNSGQGKDGPAGAIAQGGNGQ